MATTNTVPVPRFPAPGERYDRENEAQFRRALERAYLDVTGYVEQTNNDPLAVAPHAIATTTGLGAQHTASGLTAGEVLRASGADTAAFAVLNFTDLAGKLADAQVDSAVTYSNIQRVGALIVGTIVQGFGLIDNRPQDVLTRQMISSGSGAAIATTGSITSELRLNVGRPNTFAALFFTNRVDTANEVGGRINVNLVGVETVIINLKKDLTELLTWDVSIDKSLTVVRDFAIIGSDLTGIPAFWLHGNSSTIESIEDMRLEWSLPAATVQTASFYPTLQTNWRRIGPAQAKVSDVILFMPVAYVPITGQPVNVGHLKWTAGASTATRDNGDVALEISATTVTIVGSQGFATTGFGVVNTIGDTLLNLGAAVGDDTRIQIQGIVYRFPTAGGSAGDVLTIDNIDAGPTRNLEWSAAVALDHGTLTGLGDDDHTQYTLADGTRAFTGDQSFGGNDITSVLTITTTGAVNIGGDLNHDGPNVGFFATAPAAQTSAYTQTFATATRTHANPTGATLTDSTGGTADQTLSAIAAVDGSGATTAQEGIINDNFAELADEINKLVADLDNVKQLVNSVIDDGQTYGLLQ